MVVGFELSMNESIARNAHALQRFEQRSNDVRDDEFVFAV
ncbi:hypothetical protein O971_17915 [Mycobacterium avium subsp. hominissuis 10-4249]|nr:hypothetical protein O982_18725 [Mycobacterium avium 10-5581]ETB27169.1 hypothetical protein O971_17915 [Mycobacterium avium subsp. hominissuis 10-4249]KDO98035.1 hypothetical protein MAVA5_03980 [Mycobacterium avium subsp. hominissuis A5]